MKSQINNINEIICRFISNIILTLLDEEHDNAPELNAEEIKLHNINEKISKKLKEKNIAEKIEEYLKVNYKVDSKHLVEIVNSVYKNDKLIDLNKLINNYIEISNGDKYLLNDNDIRILNEIEVILEELYFDVSMDVISLREQWRKNITIYFENEIKSLNDKIIKFENHIKVYKNDLIAYENEINELNKLNDKLYKEKTGLQNNLNFTSDKLKISEDKLQESNKKIANIVLKVNNLNEENCELKEEIINLRKKIKSLESIQAKVGIDEKRKNEYENLINDYKNLLNKKEKELKEVFQNDFNNKNKIKELTLALSKGKKENEYEVNKIKLDFKSEIEELETEHEQMLEEKETEIKNIVYKKDAELKQAFQVNFNDKSKIKELTLELSKIKKEKEIEFNNYKINIKSEMKDLENEYEEIIQKKEAEVKKLSYANLECKKIIEELEVSKNKFNNKEKEYMKKIEVLEKEINELNLKINNSIKEEKKAKILTVKEKIDIKIDSATALSILSSNLGFIAKTDKGLKAVLQKEFDSFEIFKIDLNNSVKEGNCIKISRNIKKLIELVENISNKIKLYSIDLPNSNEDIIKDFKKIDNLVN